MESPPRARIVPAVHGHESVTPDPPEFLTQMLDRWRDGAQVVWSGLHLVALGIVGQYVWRALDEARGRPVYAVEAVTGLAEAVGLEGSRRR